MRISRRLFLLVLALTLALAGLPGSASAERGNDPTTYVVQGSIPATSHVHVYEIGFCTTPCHLDDDLTGALSTASVGSDGKFVLEEVPADDYGVAIRYTDGDGHKYGGYLTPEKDDVYRLSNGTFRRHVVIVSGDTALGVLHTKAFEKHYPDGDVALTGGGTLGGRLTLFFVAKHLRRVTQVDIRILVCGQARAHRRFTHLKGRHDLRVDVPTQTIPRWVRYRTVVAEPGRDPARFSATAGPVPQGHPCKR